MRGHGEETRGEAHRASVDRSHLSHLCDLLLSTGTSVAKLFAPRHLDIARSRRRVAVAVAGSAGIARGPPKTQRRTAGTLRTGTG